jgi:hypothetical protein
MSRQAGILNLARRRPDHYVRAKLILQLKRAARSRPVASKRSTTLFALGLGLSHQAEERRISRLPFRCRHQFLARLGIGLAVRPLPIALGAPIFESRHQGHLLRPLGPSKRLAKVVLRGHVFRSRAELQYLANRFILLEWCTADSPG